MHTEKSLAEKCTHKRQEESRANVPERDVQYIGLLAV
jgi:hypothetical protein